jgi:AraC-like DNA-binding protein
MPTTPTTARLLMPQKALSSLIFAAIVRDTRGVTLSDAARYNCFPASPLCAVTRVFEGQIFEVDNHGRRANSAMPTLSVSGPYHAPKISWNPGPVHAVTVGFYPDAFAQLTGAEPAALICKTTALTPNLSSEFFDCFLAAQGSNNNEDWFDCLQDQFKPHWRAQRQISQSGARLKDWAASLMARALLSGRGRSLRQVQRHFKALTGQSQRDLQRHIRMEALFARTRGQINDTSLAELSAELEFADQSHMGREVRRLTGETPLRINHLIQTDERYWCYRLLGQRF